MKRGRTRPLPASPRPVKRARHDPIRGQCFRLWPRLIPEMQCQVAEHLDKYSRQALAMTCTTGMAGWKMTTPLDPILDLGQEAHVSYVANQWAILTHEPPSHMDRLALLMTGMARRTDPSMFFEYTVRLEKHASEHGLVLTGYEFMCLALLRASVPSMIERAFREQPQYFSEEHFDLLSFTTMADGILSVPGNVRPDPGMMDMISRHCFGSEGNRSIEALYRWLGEFVCVAVARHEVAYLIAACATDAPLALYMASENSVKRSVMECVFSCDTIPTLEHVLALRSLVDLAPRYKWTRDFYVVILIVLVELLANNVVFPADLLDPFEVAVQDLHRICPIFMPILTLLPLYRIQ